MPVLDRCMFKLCFSECGVLVSTSVVALCTVISPGRFTEPEQQKLNPHGAGHLLPNSVFIKATIKKKVVPLELYAKPCDANLLQQSI